MAMRISDIDVSGTAPPLHIQMGIEEAYVEQEQADLKAIHRLRVRGLMAPQMAVASCNLVLDTTIRRLVGTGVLQQLPPPNDDGVSESADPADETPAEEELKEVAVGDAE